jgi:hypothetical protein
MYNTHIYTRDLTIHAGTHIQVHTHIYVNLNANITPHVHQTHAKNSIITGTHIQAHMHTFNMYIQTFQHNICAAHTLAYRADTEFSYTGTHIGTHSYIHII